MRFGLTSKLVASTLLVLAVTVGGLVAAVHWTFEEHLSAYLLRVETEQVQPLVALLGREYERSGGWDFLFVERETWPELVRSVLDPDTVEPAPGEPPPDSVGMLPRLSIADADGYVVMHSPLRMRERDHGLWVELPIRAGGKEVGTLRMLPTPVPVKGLDQQFRHDQLRAFYLAALPALFVALLIAIPLGYHFVRPLQNLTRRLHLLAAGDYDTRLPPGRGDELGQVAADFNHLACTLQRSETLRREGMASVSHELRTPLATMIASVEAMRDGIRPLNAEQLRILAGSMDYLNHLVDDLYQLALADVGVLVCHKESLAWDALVGDVLDMYHGRLAARGLQLHSKIAPTVQVSGDPLRLRQLLANLLENCCRYATAGGQVHVRLHADHDSAQLSVSDSGPGVDEQAIPALFERFYRADASRSRATGGAGLGLALVKAIAEAHGGSVSATRSTLGGLCVTVALAVEATA